MTNASFIFVTVKQLLSITCIYIYNLIKLRSYIDLLTYDHCLYKDMLTYDHCLYNISQRSGLKSLISIILYISVVNVDILLTYEMKSGIPVTILKTLSFHFVHLVPILFAAIRVARSHTTANVFNTLPRGRRELELYATADPGVRLLIKMYQQKPYYV